MDIFRYIIYYVLSLSSIVLYIFGTKEVMHYIKNIIKFLHGAIIWSVNNIKYILFGALIGLLYMVITLLAAEFDFDRAQLLWYAFALSYVVSIVLHHIVYKLIVKEDYKLIDPQVKEKCTEEYMKKFYKFLFSLDYLVSAMYKIRIESIYKKEECPGKKASLIKNFNIANLVLSIVLLVACVSVDKMEWVIVPQWLKLIAKTFICYRLLSRSFEIIMSFGSDILQSEKTSSLQYVDRIKLSLKSLVEICCTNWILYIIVVRNDDILGNLYRSIGITIIADVDFTIYYNKLNELSFNSTNKIIAGVDVRWGMLLQLITCIILYTLSINSYINSKKAN